jgi:serine/threonine protein kinase
MTAPTSPDELLQLIRKSGTIDDERLTTYIHCRQSGQGFPSDVREFTEELIQAGILTYFQAEQFLLGKWRGFTIGKYQLLERVGVGGMGQVFLCEHTFMKRRVAVKVLPPAKAEQPGALGRFYREARAAGSLQHPHIVRTHDIDQDGNLHFIVMDYVDGSDLLAIVKQFGPLDMGRAAHYVTQVADGLDHAFRSGIIHRDVKPGNILVDRQGVARILDLGLARFYKDHGDLLTLKYDDKIVLGTADYVAPEQIANSHSVDIRADIYALGATLYFLLAGHPPFPTGSVSQKLLWHRTKEPTPIRQVRPGVPHELAAIVTRMMAKDPKARYQTPAQVLADVAACVPSRVPLPAPEEMPRLSPAVRAGAPVEYSVDLPVSGARASSLAAVITPAGGGTAAAAALTEPRAPTYTSPFGPPATTPWSAPLSPTPRAPMRGESSHCPTGPAGSQADVDTTGGPGLAPTARRSSASLGVSPNAAELPGEIPPAPFISWPLLIAAAGGAAAVGVIAALIKLLG